MRKYIFVTLLFSMSIIGMEQLNTEFYYKPTVTPTEVQQFIQNGGSINFIPSNPTAFPHLVRSIYNNNHPNLTKVLLNYGADPNITTHTGATPLAYAIAAENIEKINILLAYNPINKEIPTAIKKGNLHILHMLIQKEENPTQYLSDAIKTGNKDIISLFLENGACPNYHIIALMKKIFTLELPSTRNSDIHDIALLLCKYATNKGEIKYIYEKITPAIDQLKSVMNRALEEENYAPNKNNTGILYHKICSMFTNDNLLEECIQYAENAPFDFAAYHLIEQTKKILEDIVATIDINQ